MGFQHPAVNQKITDYFWHITGSARGNGHRRICGAYDADQNAFLDEIRKQYVVTARKGTVRKSRSCAATVFRNAMLLQIAGFPPRSSVCFLLRLSADRGDVFAQRIRAVGSREATVS